MGIEEYGVRLTCRGHADNVSRLLRERFMFQVDRSYVGRWDESFLRHEDEDHLVECEMNESAGAVSLSLRVALCHPATIDDAFSGLIVELMGELGATVVVPDDTEERSPDVYVASQAEVCRAAIVRAIGDARMTWTAVAGLETAKLSCRDALRRFIVERGS